MIENVVHNFASLHPFFVHFPIAFLFAYSFFAFARVLITNPEIKNAFWEAERVSLIVAFLSIFPAFFAGDTLAERLGETRAIELHESFASALVFFVFLIFAIYFAESIWRFAKARAKDFGAENVFLFFERVLKLHVIFKAFAKARACTFAIAFFVVLIFALVSFLGALGAGIAHGQKADFFVKFVYTLFGF